ncbi:MAG: T9SS type A sorting domain-containing protein [Bacteroidota bacterium]
MKFSFLVVLLFTGICQPLWSVSCEINADNLVEKSKALHESLKEGSKNVVPAVVIEAFLAQYLPTEGTSCALPNFEFGWGDFRELEFAFPRTSGQILQHQVVYLDLISGTPLPRPIVTKRANLKVQLPLNASLTLVAVFADCLDGSQSNLNIIIVDRDLFRCPVPDLEGRVATTDLDLKNSIQDFTIFPNPTSGVIDIAYTLMEDTQLQMVFFDAWGRQVSSLVVVDEKRKAGPHKFRHDLRMLPPGIYFLRLIKGTQSMVRAVRKH